MLCSSCADHRSRGCCLLPVGSCWRRRGIGDSSLEKLQAAAAAQGHTLCALLFGSGGAGQAAAADGVAAPVLPTLPDRKELGLTAKAAAAVEAFRELMAGLHAAVASQPLDRALEQILAKVSAAGTAWACRQALGRCVPAAPVRGRTGLLPALLHGLAYLPALQNSLWE